MYLKRVWDYCFSALKYGNSYMDLRCLTNIYSAPSGIYKDTILLVQRMATKMSKKRCKCRAIIFSGKNEKVAKMKSNLAKDRPEIGKKLIKSRLTEGSNVIQKRHENGPKSDGVKL